MKPGDFIVWTYKATGELVGSSETLWSSTLQKYVPVGRSNNLLISIHEENDKQVITWLNDKGLFHAHVDDTQWLLSMGRPASVVPRARG